jgi:hypothetical protein
MPYSPEELTFEGMEPGAGQLLESLGLLEEFIEDTQDNYGITSFVDYVTEMREDPDSTELAIILSVARTEPEEFQEWTQRLLGTIESWREISILQAEEEDPGMESGIEEGDEDQ